MHESEKEMPQNRKIQWHPGFYAAAEIELRENREELEFHREYNLSKKPLQIDLLIIEKLKDVQIQNEIGSLFRRYNIIEYKSPEDNLNIDDFFKTCRSSWNVQTLLQNQETKGTQMQYYK